MSSCDQLNGDVESLEALTNLDELNLSCCFEVTGNLSSFQRMHKLWDLDLTATFLRGSLTSLEGMTSLWNLQLDSSHEGELHIEGDLSSLGNLSLSLRKLAITNVNAWGRLHEPVGLKSAIVFTPAQSIDHAAHVIHPSTARQLRSSRIVTPTAHSLAASIGLLERCVRFQGSRATQLTWYEDYWGAFGSRCALHQARTFGYFLQPDYGDPPRSFSDDPARTY